MVGQAPEGLRADDVLRSRLGERRHLGGDEPPLPHLHPLVHDEICTLPQMFEVVHGLEAAVFLREADELSLLCEQPAVGKRKERGRRAPSAVELGVVEIIDDAVQDEVHEGGHDGLATLGKQEIFKMRIAQGGILDVDLPHDAHFDFGLELDGHVLKRIEDILHVARVPGIALVVEGGADILHALLARLGGGALFLFIGLRLIEGAHDEIAVEDGIGELQQKTERDLQPVPLLEARKVQREHGNFGEFRLQRLADERDIVARAAPAARLRDHDRRMLGVVLPALQSVEVLPDDAERGIAGVVVDVLQALVDDGAPLVLQNFHFIAFEAHDVHQKIEMPREHIGDEDGVRRLHGGGKSGIIVCKIDDGSCLFLLLHALFLSRSAFCSSMAARSDRNLIFTTPRLLISSILICV